LLRKIYQVSCLVWIGSNNVLPPLGTFLMQSSFVLQPYFQDKKEISTISKLTNDVSSIKMNKIFIELFLRLFNKIPEMSPNDKTENILMANLSLFDVPTMTTSENLRYMSPFLLFGDLNKICTNYPDYVESSSEWFEEEDYMKNTLFPCKAERYKASFQ